MTMENLGGALVVLAAVLLGAALPALVQLRATLKTLERTGARLDATLVSTGALAVRLEGLVAKVDRDGRVERVLDGVADATGLVTRFGDTVRMASAVGAAVAPAVVAAVQAFRGVGPEDPAEAGEAAPERTAPTTQHGGPNT